MRVASMLGGMAAVMAGFAGSAGAQPARPVLSMSCHLMLRGVPSKEATLYELVGNDLYSVNGATRTRISTQGTSPLSLGSSREKDGTTTESFASHVVDGSPIERTVYWKQGSGPMKEAFKERYDFKARTVVNAKERDDICHTNGV